jgi:hypothetical protein
MEITASFNYVPVFYPENTEKYLLCVNENITSNIIIRNTNEELATVCKFLSFVV